jgi:hypothetical protein
MASSAMNGVAPADCASAFKRPAAASGISKDTTLPRGEAMWRRGWSVGNSSTAGAPSSRSRQKASSWRRVSPWSFSRCQRAKSPKRALGSGSGEGWPAAKAL